MSWIEGSHLQLGGGLEAGVPGDLEAVGGALARQAGAHAREPRVLGGAAVGVLGLHDGLRGLAEALARCHPAPTWPRKTPREPWEDLRVLSLDMHPDPLGWKYAEADRLAGWRLAGSPGAGPLGVGAGLLGRHHLLGVPRLGERPPGQVRGMAPHAPAQRVHLEKQPKN